MLKISLDKLYNKKAGHVVFKESSKYPDIEKDVAFIIDKSIYFALKFIVNLQS